MNTERILVVDDEPDICGLVSDILTDEGYQVSAAETAASAREQITQADYDLVLLDIWMPDEDGITLLKDWKDKKVLQCPVVMMSGHGTVETAVEATRLGAYAFVEKPLTTAKLIQTIRKALDSVQVNEPAQESTNTIISNVNKSYISPIGTSEVMQKLLEICQRCAQLNTHLLITGEEGAGRYTAARYIHEISERKGKPYILVKSEQFGVDRIDEAGWSKLKAELIDSIKLAQDGSVLFQNIDQINSVILKRFVDLLQQLSAVQVFKRFNVKVMISASTQMPAEVINGLQTTLSMTRISIPPLRNHIEDIPELVNYLIDSFCVSDNYDYRKCSIAAQNAFLHYAWPRNIAELKAIIQQLLVTGGSEEITVDDVKQALALQQTTNSEGAVIEELFDMPLREAREAFEKQYLLHQLKKVNGSVSKLAELVGMERTHLYRKLRSLGIGSKDSN